MKSAGYVVLFAIAGCSQGVCRSIGSAPGTAPNPGAAAEEPVTAALVNSGEQEVLDEELAQLRKGGRHLIAGALAARPSADSVPAASLLRQRAPDDVAGIR